MKTATTSSLQVTPELCQAAESVLREEKAVSPFGKYVRKAESLAALDAILARHQREDDFH